jgi:predicted transcriptional regulator
MTPHEIKRRRIELELTVEELAFALDVPADELRRCEAGESEYARTAAFADAFDAFEERVFGSYIGA